MPDSLAKTPLHQWHSTHGGRMVEFGGWSMPVQYESIVVEHQATRQAAGLFDISHMGRLRFDGPDAARWIDSLVTRSVDPLKPGQIRYGLVTNELGGVLDDVLVYRLADAAGGTYHVMVVNAGNRAKIVDWINAHQGGHDATMMDLTSSWGMIAIQGPKALEILAPSVSADLASMKFYTGCETEISGHGGVVSRTGYTGEDGFELMLGAAMTESVWQELIDRGAELGIKAAGLGCRDTLRLEAAMPLYGHELDEETTPWEAGLKFAVNLNKPEFVGQQALRDSQKDPLRALAGFKLEGRRTAREGYTILADGKPVGTVTSGTFSPTLDQPIAMGYVPPAMIGQTPEWTIDVRGQAVSATRVELPFYRRS